MSAPLRFLALVVLGWGAVRWMSADGLPGTVTFSDTASASVPAIVPTQFPPLPPVEAAPSAMLEPQYYYPPAPAGAVMPPSVPVYYYYPVPVQPAAVPIMPRRAPLSAIPDGPAFDYYEPPADSWSLATALLPPLQSSPVPAAPSVPAAPPGPPKLDRLQLTAWALLRGRNGTPALASGGTLGGSQAGSRLTYHLTNSVAASLRTTSPVGGRGAEIAAGVRYRPLSSVPVWLTAERRQRIGRDGGRSAFAVFAEGGVYQRPIIGKVELDAYAQGGVVGARSRDLFADGAFTLTRPLFKTYSAGFGVWGGAQPGLYRVDVGPRLSMRVRGTMRVHLDWRQRLAGNAEPGSGPALTLAGDF